VSDSFFLFEGVLSFNPQLSGFYVVSFVFVASSTYGGYGGAGMFFLGGGLCVGLNRIKYGVVE